MFVNDLSCGVKNMNIKITALAIILATGFPFAAQAQTPSQPGVDVQTPSQPGVDVQTPSQPGVDVQTPSQPGVDVQTPSQPGVDVQTPGQPEVDLQEQQNNFDVETPSAEPGFNVEEQESDLTPSRRTRTRRTRSSSLDSKYYAGGDIGLFVPFFGGDNADADPGIDFNGLFGYKVNKNISAEVELFNARGGTEVDDLGYNLFGASANGVYRYYFNPDSSKSLYAFGGLGLGFGVLSATGDVADRADDAGTDTSDAGFLLQSKVGVGYPLTDNIDLFGQTRYTNVFIGEEDGVPDSGDDGNGLSFDVGATFNF
jgi:Outer membrane protein beta-barrel domain